MQTAILTLHVIVCIFLVILVLLQSGREGMGVIFGGGGDNSVFGTSGAGGILVKLTTFLAVIFVCTSLGYNLMVGNFKKEQKTVLDVKFEEVEAPAAKTEPAKTDAPASQPAPAAAPADAPKADAPAAPAVNGEAAKPSADAAANANPAEANADAAKPEAASQPAPAAAPQANDETPDKAAAQPASPNAQ